MAPDNPPRLSPSLAAIAIAALLAGCTPAPYAALAVADAASIMVFQRGATDLLASGFTGRDCSIVRLDRGETYCRPLELPPPPQQYCTRTLGTADCWASPIIPANPPRGLADGPNALTPEQDANRTRPWPSIFYW